MLDLSSVPDTIYLHGQILTMDAVLPTAQALAVTGERLLAVGSDASIAARAGRQTRRVDLGGRFVLPGFHDAHTHQLSAGMSQLELDLSGTHSLAELQQRVRAYAATLPEGEWIIGSGWDHTLWPGQAFPTRHDLDAVSGGHPAYLHRLDTHAAVANSLALRVGGVAAAAVIPAGGRLGTDAHGEPDGMLFEDARGLVADNIPPASPARMRRALALAMRDALAHGVTSVQDYSGWDAFLVYEQMQEEGELQFRLNEWLNFKDPLPILLARSVHRDPHDLWLRTGMLKAFLDGSLGSRTAALLAPYADAPDQRGLPQYEQAELNQMAIERARAGFQLGFHAIGDGAVGMALEAFAATGETQGRRHRIEHLQLVAPGDVARLRRLGVIASVQPAHLLDDARWAEARLGAARAQDSYLWRSLLDEGVVLAFGSDCPVAGISPFPGIYAALSRASADGQRQYANPGEAVSLAQALYAYTLGGAMAEFTEADKGSLAAGKLADFCVLSQDLRTVSAKEILASRVELTVVGGQARHGK